MVETTEGRGIPRTLIFKVARGILRALVVWIGEAAVGLLPLMTHVIVTKNSRKIVVSAWCETGLNNCREVSDSLPLAEMDILAVIVCGLAILSIINFGPHNRRRETTALTYLVGIFTVLLMIFGSILYAIATAGIGQDNENVTTAILVLSLIASFYLALEEAWLDAIHAPSSAQVQETIKAGEVEE